MAEGVGFLIGMIIAGVIGVAVSMLIIWLFGEDW